jgi:hypothetical protein
MGRMVRKQIVIEPEQDKLLADLAKERGVSQSQLIRTAIAEYVARVGAEAERDQAFERLMESFRNAPNLGLTDEDGNRTWTRESLYEDRLRRY